MFDAKLAMGTWSWGSGANGGDRIFGNHLSETRLRQVVDAAMRVGFNLWDTAAVYGEGSSEKLLGNMLMPYKRSEYYLSTKFTPQIANDGPTPMADMLVESLTRLHTDYVDLYWIHNPADVDKWTQQLIPLVKNGLVKHVGVSNHNLAQIKRASGILAEAGIPLAAVQNHYSLLYRSSEDAGILDYCRERGIDFFAYMVLEQGALSGKYNVDHPLPAGSNRAKVYNQVLPQLTALTTAMQQIGQQHHASVADVATAWAIGKGTLPIVGVTRQKYVADQKRATQLVLTTSEVDQLEQLARQTGVDTKAFWEKSMTE